MGKGSWGSGRFAADEDTWRAAREALALARERMLSGKYDVIISTR